jgi:uncharacterized protein (TIGR02271 family)
MQHTVAAVFDNYNEAQHAFDDLVASGFSREDVHLSQSNEAGSSVAGDATSASERRVEDDESGGTGIGSFFRRLFGSDDETSDAELYSEAVRRGSYVLTVEVPDDNLVDQATDVLDRHHPVNIDERASQWKSGGWASQESMRQSGAASETTSTAPGQVNTTQGMQGDARSIPVVEEELRVGKRQVQRGGVRVYQRTTEEPVHESVQLRDEKVKVERHPVDKPASEADISALKDTAFELRETAEEPVVEKTARVVEEVVVGKEAAERTETIDDKVRRTDVEVEQLSGQPRQFTDDDFRSHWNSTYAQSGETYEDYAPAYQYGTSIGANERYKGRAWSDIESDVRTDWESKHPTSTWQRFKDAIRHGWEKVMT